MKSALWRGDLLRALARQGNEQFVARALGLESTPDSIVGDESRRDARAAPTEDPELPLEGSEFLDAGVPFLRVTRFEPLGETGEIDEPSTGEQEDREGPVLKLTDLVPRAEHPPPHPPLESWPRLWRWLRTVLRRPVDSEEVDVETLVHRLSRGERLSRIPRRPCRWPASQLLVLVDRSRRLAPFWSDQDALLASLKSAFGDRAITVHRFLYGPEVGPSGSEGRRPAPLPPAVSTPALLLSDLGARGGRPEQLAWRKRGERLQRFGYTLCALTPCPPERVPRRLAELWAARTWDRGSPRGVTEPRSRADRESRVLRLLRLLSPAVRIEPGLLRAARLLLGQDDADVGTEYDAWTHATVRARNTVAMALEADVLDELRQSWKRRDEAPDVRVALVEALREWHACLPLEIWAEEGISLSRLDPGLLPRDELRQLEEVLRSITREIVDGEEVPAGVEAWFRRLSPRVPDTLWSDPRLGTLLGQAWGEVHREDSEARVPPGIEPGDLSRGTEPITHWNVLQRAGLLELVPKVDGSEEHPPCSSWITTVELREPLLALRERDEHGVQCAVEPDRGAHFLLPGWSDPEEPDRPKWARDFGRDAYGVWAEDELAGVRFRMRWIPPGHFRMGSPPGEYGRWVEEPLHHVELSSGYWIAETPCTQELWTAVRSHDPSGFAGLDRPVESVSWEDVQAFLAPFQQTSDEAGVILRLPTEAEWERACRAGTTTTTWTGDIENEEHEKRVLDPIAWWVGNSGRSTQPVAAKSPNPWGLFDMLGNVWEWCEDSIGSLDDLIGQVGDAPRRDPVGSEGALRVVRGGSWFLGGSRARAAARYAFGPTVRSHFLGFRLARGPVVRSSRGGAESGAGRATDEEPRHERSLPKILTDRGRWTLDWTPEPDWAHAIGRDRFGLWADWRVGEVTQRFRWVSPGRFLMGSPEDEEGRFHNEPQHPVALTRGLWLAETPCTQALWQVVMGNNPSGFPGERNPVERVSFEDVQDFLKRALGAAGSEPLRLPSEAEWEWAARAGSTAARYGDIDGIAWFDRNSGNTTHPVAFKAGNPWGFHDMLGNVWEWCLDRTRESDDPSVGSTDSLSLDPVGSEGARRVLRGGSWLLEARSARAAARYAREPADRSVYLGFRLARDPGVRSSLGAPERGARSRGERPE